MVFVAAWTAVLVAALVAQNASAQDLTPRTYWPAPNGTKLLIFGYAYQSGDVVTDPSIPITGVDSTIDSTARRRAWSAENPVGATSVASAM
jgi:hypothetical protein